MQTSNLETVPLFTPPLRRWSGPIIDAHMHAKDVASIQAYWDIAEPIYGVRFAVPIVELETGIALRGQYGGRVQPAIWGIRARQEDLRDIAAFRKEKEALLDRIAESGMRIVKLWFTPRFHEWSNLRLDDQCLDFFFDRLSMRRLAVLIHVADPDYWFNHRINDLEAHGTKAEHYLQLRHRLERHPDITFQAAHFGGHPEDLNHLSNLLEQFPNLVFDSSATKWVAREFPRHGTAGRDFLIQYADRIVFGTDLVANPDREKEGKREHYATRFYVHQMLWEQTGTFVSPIEDDDSPTPVSFQGLYLPEPVLAKFYWENAARLHGFTADATAGSGTF